jgi:hypothetical protein
MQQRLLQATERQLILGRDDICPWLQSVRKKQRNFLQQGRLAAQQNQPINTHQYGPTPRRSNTTTRSQSRVNAIAPEQPDSTDTSS